MKQVGQFVQEAVQQSVRQKVGERGDEMHRKGFSTAAGIALRHIDAKLESFKEQMKGPGLTKAEQAVYVQLDGLKTEIEAACDRFWQGSGVDWRPVKPVAKGVIRRTEEPQL